MDAAVRQFRRRAVYGPLMDCVVVAGGRPEPVDPLYDYTKGGPKALLEIGGRPLIYYVIRALLAAQTVERIVVVGLELETDLGLAGTLEYIPDQGDLIANGLAGLARIQALRPTGRHILFSSADIPAINGAIVDELVTSCRPYDKSVYYFMVERQAMEQHFLGSKRTYVSLQGMKVAGADMFVADGRLAAGNTDLLYALAAGRKQAWKLARLVGLTTVTKLLLHRLTLTEIEQRAEEIVGAPISVRLTNHAQLAMDVDKPRQLHLLQNGKW